MKELLYLKDDQLKAFIEKLFMAYRESVRRCKSVIKQILIRFGSPQSNSFSFSIQSYHNFRVIKKIKNN